MSGRVRVGAAALAVAALAACSGGPSAAARTTPSPGTATAVAAAPSTPATTPPPTEPQAATASPATRAPTSARPAPAAWQVGASPLPLRPDGFGQVLPTPEVLRHRSLPTTDVLPPPADGAFHGTVAAIAPDVRARMGQTWSEGCPVALADLRYLTVSFVGFDGRAHTGELVVAASVADDVVGVFRRLFAARYPVEEMRLPTGADLTAPPTGDGNNTAAFVCRAARGQTRWSAHALGLAVDVNPFMNPLKKRDLVLPELASSYLDRADVRPGMNERGGPAVRAFAAIGWTWGGSWSSSKDYMHFSKTGD